MIFPGPSRRSEPVNEKEAGKKREPPPGVGRAVAPSRTSLSRPSADRFSNFQRDQTLFPALLRAFLYRLSRARAKFRAAAVTDIGKFFASPSGDI